MDIKTYNGYKIEDILNTKIFDDEDSSIILTIKEYIRKIVLKLIDNSFDYCDCMSHIYAMFVDNNFVDGEHCQDFDGCEIDYYDYDINDVEELFTILVNSIFE